MSEERSSNDPDEKSWIGKLTDIFSPEAKNSDDLREQIRSAEQNEIIDADALSIIEGAMEVSRQKVRDILIPSTKMVSIAGDSSIEDTLEMVIESSHSRFPVFGEDRDDILGILLAKDLLPQLLKRDSDFNLKSVIRPVYIVPESKRLNVLLREFRENRNHMAVVIDEYGCVAGLVTIEDVLEQIVGDIEDEYDTETEEEIHNIDDNNFLVKAITSIEDFNESFDSGFSDEEFDTIGGLVSQSFGRLPEINDKIVIEGFEFQVIEADGRRIETLSVTTP
ncbi:Magnesium and cobalt efflux protein CorC [Sinobacterium norvegicum]|uniref:Magnesium and cobalt efflux protein CorC n=1 Tax=Sinobacterium norvegicum TaxID=1641715 RepID=A0ABM9AEK1_9GAMM|nr:transporter associated domain-containing protein [Sinobacterium norvegicum]CAH0991634.1 Magnesium and cobalt efflux protein CorC [Sinobacterium norvegicum]